MAHQFIHISGGKTPEKDLTAVDLIKALMLLPPDTKLKFVPDGAYIQTDVKADDVSQDLKSSPRS